MLRSLLLGSVVLGTASIADADTWLTAEAPAAFAASDVQQGVFRPGLMPAFGAYIASPRAALGIRMRAGILRDGPAPDDPFRDPGTGGLISGGIAVRAPLPAGAWIEGVAGAGVTGADVAPVVELGIGWLTSAGRFELGPSARVIHVVAPRDMTTLGSATIATFGLEVRIGGSKRRRRPVVEQWSPPVAREVVTAPVPPPVEVPRDPDRVVDHDESCRQSLDGCFSADGVTVEGDRIILEERVMFDTSRARVHRAGRSVIERIAQEWQRHPEWTSLRIEGHADVRGPDAFNQWLSDERAARVQAVFETAGIPSERLEAVGFGRTHPRAPGTTEADNRRNRRVEFVIGRSGTR